MARVEDLIDQIADPELRDRISLEVKDLKETKRFGLVFEEHVPETVSLYGLPVRPGSLVQNRTTPDDLTEYRVLSVSDGEATVRPKGRDKPTSSLATADLLTVKRFHEQIFPGLTPVGEIHRGPAGKPAHVVINGENFHALQVLTYTFAGLVDCIYIDPPYNTGHKTWKYNNRFVDDNDSYRHSKWLSFMAKRLKLAKALLKPEGVLIVTIDEHEVHRLGVLLSEVFREAQLQMVTIVTSSKGSSRKNLFSRVEEYAFFAFHGDACVVPQGDNFLTETAGEGTEVEWESLLRRGDEAFRVDRPAMFYPILIDPDTGRIAGAGLPFGKDQDPEIDGVVDGLRMVWPIRRDLSLGRWRIGRETFERLRAQGFVRLGKRDKRRRTSAVLYLQQGKRDLIKDGKAVIRGFNEAGVADVHYLDFDVRRPRTVWVRPAHSAGDYGSTLLKKFLGARLFDYPKSLYAVRDTLATIVGNKPDALVLDFFAGSGTTLHAVAVLNAADNGSRRCVLVTNNELSEKDESEAHKTGMFRGDPDYESRGIFEAVTRPRCEAAIIGVRPDKRPVEGEYLDQYLEGHAHADGFEENVVFLRLDYLDPDLVELGRQFNAIAPLLWMASGSVGNWEEWDGAMPWTMPPSSKYAVLFDESESAEFVSLVESRIELTHIWLVTNSHSAFTEMRSSLPSNLEVRQLYRDYLRNFTINAPGVMR